MERCNSIRIGPGSITDPSSAWTGRYTIGEVCNLTIEFSDALPDDLLGSLMYFLNAGDRDLLEGLASDRSYAGGARCLLKLMSRRASDSQTLEETRRNG